MKSCNHLYILSTIACQLAQCLDEKELSMLSADLEVLANMLEVILAREFDD